MCDQKNPYVHIYAGNLLMTTGAYFDAIKAFDNADTVQQTALASFQRIRCYCALSDLEKAFEQMQLCLHLAPNEKFCQYDFKVLLPLLSCVRSFEFSKNDKGEKDTDGEEEQR
jgi:tetratricopeptide (TPR) repeat protein